MSVKHSSVGHDANDCIYPVAYAVVQKENTQSWRWFMKYLAEDIEMGNGNGWTLMTDRQKGLQNVCEELFPEAEHRFCVRHMYTNFFNAGFKDKILKDFIWRAAKSTYVAEYKMWMQKTREVSEEAHKWLTKKHPQEWSQSHFSMRTKCDTVLNNGCEVFNKTLLDDKEKLILNMLMSVQMGVMTRIQKRREKMRRCEGRLCPKIRQKLHKIAERSRECTLHFSRGPRWQVDYSSGMFVIDLEERTCACRKWECTSIPCMHVVDVIRDCRNAPEDYVDNCYTIKTYMRCYDNIMNPMNGTMLWPEVDTPAIIQPHWTVPQKGKKQKRRRKQAKELVVHTQGKSYVKKKRAMTMTCSTCGLKGHNKRYHSRDDAPVHDWLEVELEFVESNCNIAVNERGKMVTSRRNESAAIDNPIDEHEMQFMPTPMVAGYTCTGNGSSPASNK